MRVRFPAMTTRRYFFFGSLLAGAVPTGGYGSVPSLRALGYKPFYDKLNVAAIGCGGRGNEILNDAARTENIVALCDVDLKRGEGAIKRYEKLPLYRDYRTMLDKEGKNIDAVTIAIPDFMHAAVALAYMQAGKHVYLEKPLARTPWETRLLLDAAVKYKVATQMGNQGYSNEGARQCAEIIWSGEIGQVKEVHAWTNRPMKYWPQGPEVEPKPGAVPSTLDWNLWLGPAAERPFSPAYAPRTWRGFPDFGCGAIGDMACHILGTPNMALRLGAPESVECIKQVGKGPHTFPQQAVIRFDFPARGAMGPVKVFWHDGLSEFPQFEGIPKGELIGDKDVNGSLFIGEKGMVTTGCYGERTRLMPDARMKDYAMPAQSLTRSPGHYRDWIRAAKGGEAACSNFSVAGPFVQWMLLGVIAMRFEGKLEWDAAKMQFRNNKEANRSLRPTFRKGWDFV